MSHYTSPLNRTQLRAIAEFIAEMPDSKIADLTTVSFCGVPWLNVDSGVLRLDCSVILDDETFRRLCTLSPEAVKE